MGHFTERHFSGFYFASKEFVGSARVPISTTIGTGVYFEARYFFSSYFEPQYFPSIVPEQPIIVVESTAQEIASGRPQHKPTIYVRKRVVSEKIDWKIEEKERELAIRAFVREAILTKEQRQESTALPFLKEEKKSKKPKDKTLPFKRYELELLLLSNRF